MLTKVGRPILLEAATLSDQDSLDCKSKENEQSTSMPSLIYCSLGFTMEVIGLAFSSSCHLYSPPGGAVN